MAYSKRADKARKAKRPGKRVSDSGNIYFESRKNRSDKNPGKRLKKGGSYRKGGLLDGKALNKKISLKDIFGGK